MLSLLSEDVAVAVEEIEEAEIVAQRGDVHETVGIVGPVVVVCIAELQRFLGATHGALGVARTSEEAGAVVVQ